MKRSRVICAGLAGVCLLSMAAGCGTIAGDTARFNVPEDNSFSFSYADMSQTASAALSEEDTGYLSVFRKVTENALLALYVNEKDSNVAVADKRNGKVWYAVPPAVDTDPIATNDMKKLMRATLVVGYQEGYSNKSIDNYNSCIEGGRFIVEDQTDGVRIFYDIGDNTRTFDDLPKKLSDERFQKFFVDHPDINDVDRVRIKKYFEFDEAENVWNMVGKSQNMITLLYDIMQKVGYTEEELAKDNAEFGIVVDNSGKVYFRIPVDFRLQNESLIVNIPTAEMSYNPAIPPLSIRLLPYFGGADVQQKGYIFVPDGSGSLIPFSDRQKDTGTYDCPVYGQDLTLPAWSKPMIRRQNVMPVFGMHVEEDVGFLAVIEDSVSQSTISAVKGHTNNAYNTVYASFNYLNIDSVWIGDGSMQTQMKAVQETPYGGDLRLRYVLLAGEDSGYVGMAQNYRAYLMQKYGMTRLETVDKAPLNLEILGAANSAKSFLGFSYQGLQTLTTFEEAADIYRELQAAGVGSIQMQYSGWFNGGLQQESARKVDIPSALGGKKGFAQLAADAGADGVSLYPQVSFLTVPEDSGHFSAMENGSKTLDEVTARTYRYDVVTQWRVGRSTIVSPRYVPVMVKDFLTQFRKKTSCTNLALGDLGRELYADYRKGDTLSREIHRKVTVEQVQYLAENTDSLLLNNPIMDVVGWGDVIVDAPLDSNGFKILGQSVPFYAIALHGLVNFSGEAYNEMDDKDTYLLKMAESGAVPYFSFMQAEGSVLKESEYSNLMSNHYGSWKEDALDLYQRMEEMVRCTYSAMIVGHEEAAPDVYITRYDNGAKTLVNYSDTDVSAEGVTVKAGDFTFVKGEER